jgi:hypothetical protein
MSGRRKWSETRDSRLENNTARARYAASGEGFRARLNTQLQTLAELRRARKLTQEQLAATMQVSQAQVSRVENQADLYLSTLRTYIEALGGELQIRVAFPGGEWTDVAIGDITGAGHSSSTVAGTSTVAVTSITALSNRVAADIGLLHSTSTFWGPSLIETLAISAPLPTLKLHGTLSARLEKFCSESPGVERFAGWWGSDFSSPADIVYFAGHGAVDPERHIGIQTKVDWLRSTEPRIPEDTDSFVTSAELKER